MGSIAPKYYVMLGIVECKLELKKITEYIYILTNKLIITPIFENIHLMFHVISYSNISYNPKIELYIT
jgi:hypothetical protein